MGKRLLTTLSLGQVFTKILAFVPWLVKSLNLAIVLDKVLREISLFMWKAPSLNIPLRKEEGAFCLLVERERNYAYWIKHPS
jgi:hypothetical protein